MPIVNKNSEFTYKRLEEAIYKISKKYPFTDLFSLGKSVLAKNLFCIKVGNGKTRIFLNGAHHGLEWITSLFLTAFTEDICDCYCKNKSVEGTNISELLKKVTFYICPMVNPDGVNLAICGLTPDIPQKICQKLIIYNKNSCDFKGKWQANIRGIDLNHNYNAGFWEGKQKEKELNIHMPGPTRFSGMFPESEPEVQAMVKFTKMLKPDIAIAYHTQGEEIYYDYQALASKEAKKIGEKMARLSGYTLSAPEGIASFSGYKDWVISALKTPAYTIEAGKGKNPLPLCEFSSIYDKNRRMLVKLFTDC